MIMVETPVLNLHNEFDVRDLQKKIAELRATMVESVETPDDVRLQLLILNAGLENFLEGEYAAEEPSRDRDEEIRFADEISAGFGAVGDNYDVKFIHTSMIEEVLQEQAASMGFLDSLPDVIADAIDWDKVADVAAASEDVQEMFIDTEVYICNLYL
jgi:hypothetical protein